MIVADFPEITNHQMLREMAKHIAYQYIHSVRLFGGYREGGWLVSEITVLDEHPVSINDWNDILRTPYNPEWMHVYLNNKENPQVGGILL